MAGSEALTTSVAASWLRIALRQISPNSGDREDDLLAFCRAI